MVNHPRISTADGIGASMFTGQSLVLNGTTNVIGLRFDCFPRVRPQSTDLYAAVAFTELMTNPVAGRMSWPGGGAVSIHTNLDLAARLQVPKGRRVLLVKTSTIDPNQGCYGLVLAPR